MNIWASRLPRRCRSIAQVTILSIGLSLLLLSGGCGQVSGPQPAAGVEGNRPAAAEPGMSGQNRGEPTATRVPTGTSAAPAATSPPTPGWTSTPSTATGTPAAVPSPTANPLPAPSPTPLAASVLLGPLNHQIQTLNNCGPTSTAILLGYFDYWRTQEQVNEFVAPRPSPCTIASYIITEYGMRPELRRGYGVTRTALMARVYRLPRASPEERLAALRLLLANDIPVIALQRLEPDSSVSHYRVIHGYDDGPSAGGQSMAGQESGHFIVDDPYLGEGFIITYDEFEDYLFRASYGAAAIAVYPVEQDSQVKALMAEAGARPDARCGWTPATLVR